MPTPSSPWLGESGSSGEAQFWRLVRARTPGAHLCDTTVLPDLPGGDRVQAVRLRQRSSAERGRAGERTLNKAVRMRSVRCDVCGTKALTAASQCPKCSHLFEVRDGFGELLPLVYCSTCDSYYPESLGVCKWCGTKPEPAPIAPRIWKGAGIAALVVVLVAAWLMRDSRPKTRADTRTAAVVTSDTAPVPADTVPRHQPSRQSTPSHRV